MPAERARNALEAELCRELERLGLDEREAQAVAQAQVESSASPEREPPQHVVPVTLGWIVIRSYANRDVGLFATKEEALAEARALAEAAGASVVVHEDDNEDGT